MKRKWGIALLIIVLLLVGAFFMVTDGLSQGAKVSPDGIDLASIEDGSYTGTYDFKRWTNTLTVNVKDHQIVSIDVVDDVGAAGITNCAEETFRRVIEAQSTQVDAVAGVTVTSKAYLKAIEDALR